MRSSAWHMKMKGLKTHTHTQPTNSILVIFCTPWNPFCVCVFVRVFAPQFIYKKNVSETETWILCMLFSFYFFFIFSLFFHTINTTSTPVQWIRTKPFASYTNTHTYTARIHVCVKWNTYTCLDVVYCIHCTHIGMENIARRRIDFNRAN